MSFYHINITQRKLSTLSIYKKKPFTICTLFLAVCLQHTSFDRNSQISKKASALTK